MDEAKHEDLVEKSKAILADTFVFYMKAHAYHWNVVGSDFPQLHDFFGKLYDELHDAIDVLAEEIRMLDSFAPASLSRMIELTRIPEDEKIPTPQNMIKNLMDANDQVVQTITEGYNMAEYLDVHGYANVLQDRLSAHAKIRWMLKSIMLKNG